MLPTGVLAYNTIIASAGSSVSPATATQTVNTSQEIVALPEQDVDISNIVLSQTVIDAIQTQDAQNVDKHMNNYKHLLAKYHIAETYQNKLDELIISGRKVSDVLISYEYLYYQYGTMSEMLDLLDKRKQGKVWTDIFTEFKNGIEPYTPKNFEQSKIEELMNTPNLTPDDIMIADRLSQMNLVSFDSVIEKLSTGTSWESINLGLGILNTSNELPHVAITRIQVRNYMKSTGLTEVQVISAFILSQKYELNADQIMTKVKAGAKEESIVAQLLQEKYN